MIGGNEKNHENLGQNSWCPGQDSNWAASKYRKHYCFSHLAWWKLVWTMFCTVYNFFWEEIRIHNLLTKLEEKRLKWYGHLKRLDRTRTLRTSELKFKGKRPTGQPKTREFNQVLQDIKKSENSWKSYWKGKTVKR